MTRSVKPVYYSKGGIIPLNPLMASPGPIVYINSTLGYDAISDGADVDVLQDQSGNNNDLTKGGTVAPATIQKSGAGLSPTGANLLRFKLANPPTCSTDLGIYSLTWDWPARTNGYSFYLWMRVRRANTCGGGGNFIGLGSTARPDLSFFPSDQAVACSVPIVQLTATNGGTINYDAPVNEFDSEADAAGAGVHTLSLLVPGSAAPSPTVWLDSVQMRAGAGGDCATVSSLTEWNESISDEIQLGNRPTTTPAITGSQGLESDLGAFIFFDVMHSVAVRRRIEQYLTETFGDPI